MNRKLYPDNWEAITLSVKTAANWTCQECGKPCRPPGLRLSETEQWLKSKHPRWLSQLYDGNICKPQRFTLTTAHLDHNPANCSLENLKALCAPCHQKKTGAGRLCVFFW